MKACTHKTIAYKKKIKIRQYRKEKKKTSHKKKLLVCSYKKLALSMVFKHFHMREFPRWPCWYHSKYLIMPTSGWRDVISCNALGTAAIKSIASQYCCSYNTKGHAKQPKWRIYRLHVNTYPCWCLLLINDIPF